MPSPVNSLLCAVLAAAPLGAGWDRVFASSGFDRRQVTVLEGSSEEARSFGFVPGSQLVRVRTVTDLLNPRLQIVWENEAAVPRFEVPGAAVVFTRERWTGSPLAAGLRRGEQIIFWTAVAPGERGYERFPYLPQALAELGLVPRSESRSLWAFLDSSYRLRADLDYLATRWRSGGIAALHVAAWHYWEPDPQRDEWLARLIETCHRHAIVVYAWIELPHVSERFWQEHPLWRENTATGQDAHLDWRKLMNLADPACARAVETGLQSLVARFDWDGINLGELYFESLEGYLNPSRFTPFNSLVRREFSARNGFDPAELYDRNSKRHHQREARFVRQFLEYRADLARRLQEDWLARLEGLRKWKPWLDLAFTHIDDRFDITMRDKLGADAARLLPAAEKHGAAFVVEDPATIWHLGPERYEELARRYASLGSSRKRLAVDINIVERYQDVYPTKQQTGSELFQLVRSAAISFPRVMLYFENSILPVDWPLLAASASPAVVAEESNAVRVRSREPVIVRANGCTTVNGEVWPVGGQGHVLLPAGESLTAPCEGPADRPLRDFNGTLKSARVEDGRLRLTYESSSRAIALLAGSNKPILLPPGTHTVEIPRPGEKRTKEYDILN